nr:M23 family metallopeptidase [Sphingobium phenoxybenzoativorans]
MLLLGIGVLMLRYCVVIGPADAPEAPSTIADGSREQHADSVSNLHIPVAGVQRAQLVDTFGQSREVGQRVHDAIDILAARGTPVVAAADGVVEKLFVSAKGGNTVYVRSPDRRWTYYYAHLDRYDPALKEGQRIHSGDPIGTVGATGNALASAPHLHFAVNRMLPRQRWFEGEPVNPYPLLIR